MSLSNTTLRSCNSLLVLLEIPCHGYLVELSKFILKLCDEGIDKVPLVLHESVNLVVVLLRLHRCFILVPFVTPLLSALFHISLPPAKVSFDLLLGHVHHGVEEILIGSPGGKLDTDAEGVIFVGRACLRTAGPFLLLDHALYNFKFKL